MKRTVFQHPELRDANDNIIQQGAFGKNTALANATNDGWIDYVANDLEALHDNLNGSRIYVANEDALPATGDLSAMYITEDTGKWYVWNGTTYIESDDARKSADEAIAARDAAKASQTAAAASAASALESSTGATTAMNETKKQAQQAAASIAEASAMVDKVEKNSTIVSEQLKQAQALATASAGIQIYEDTDGDLAYRLVLPTTTEEG